MEQNIAYSSYGVLSALGSCNFCLFQIWNEKGRENLLMDTNLKIPLGCLSE